HSPVFPRPRGPPGGPAPPARGCRSNERPLPRHRDRPVVVVAVGRVNAAELDGVTVDAHGTLVRLVDPVPALAAALSARGAERPHEVVARGFSVEVEHYVEHSSEGHDEPGL